MPDGAIMETGTWSRKSSAGYDLTHLMIGSEGTLGIITRLCLKLHPRPQQTVSFVCQFDDSKALVGFVMGSLKEAWVYKRVEFLCDRSMHALTT
mgnify:CR=1 FL=1